MVGLPDDLFLFCFISVSVNTADDEFPLGTILWPCGSPGDVEILVR